MSDEDREDRWFYIISFIIIGIMCVVVAYAQPTYKEVAKNLSVTDEINTTIIIEKWLWKNINYTEKEEGIKSLKVFWRNMRGDCSEVAIAACAMAKSVGIQSRPVYGRVLEKGQWYNHAWCEYKINNTWINNQHRRFQQVKRLGYGEN